MPFPAFDVLRDLAVIFAGAVVTVIALGRLGVPSVVGFLVAGALIGPTGLGLVDAPERVGTFAELGVVVLLFVIGTELSLVRVRGLGRPVLTAALLQVTATVAVAALVAWAAGVSSRQGVFWGYAAALSSTAIVFRALEDRHEGGTPHARLVVGTAIVQDLCVVPMMLSLPLLSGEAVDPVALVGVGLRVVAVAAGGLFLARRVAPFLLARVAVLRQRELFLLTVMALALGVVLTTAAVGLSMALGGFVAGVVLADSPYVHQARGELVPFRDAFASLFFVSIGMLLDPVVIARLPLEVLAWFVAIVVGKSAIMGLVALAAGFPARVAAMSALGLAQVGEFSFVLLRLGAAQGVVPREQTSAFLAASVLSMMVTPLLLHLGGWVARRDAPLRWIDRLVKGRLSIADEAAPLRDHVIVGGLGLGGTTLLRALEVAGVPHVALELDPQKVKAGQAAGRAVRFGDAGSAEVLTTAAHADTARQLVLLLSDMDAVRRAAMAARARWPHLAVLARVHRAGPSDTALAEAGVEVVSEEWETVLEVVGRVLRRHRRQEPMGVLGPDVALEPLVVRADDRLAGRSLAESELGEITGVVVVALSRRGAVRTDPPPETRFEPGDITLLLGTHAQVERARAWIRGEGA